MQKRKPKVDEILEVSIHMSMRIVEVNFKYQGEECIKARNGAIYPIRILRWCEEFKRWQVD